MYCTQDDSLERLCPEQQPLEWLSQNNSLWRYCPKNDSLWTTVSGRLSLELHSRMTVLKTTVSGMTIPGRLSLDQLSIERPTLYKNDYLWNDSLWNRYTRTTISSTTVSLMMITPWTTVHWMTIYIEWPSHTERQPAPRKAVPITTAPGKIILKTADTRTTIPIMTVFRTKAHRKTLRRGYISTE